MQERTEVITLDYASPFTAADRLPQADAILDRPLDAAAYKEYLALFRKTKDAALYFLRHQAARFSRDRVTGQCIECGTATTNIAQLNWAQHFQLRMTELSIDTRGYSVEFPTYHSMCESCQAAANARLRSYRRSLGWAIAFALVGVGITFWSAYEPPFIRDLKERIGSWFYALPATFMLACIIVVGRRESERARCVPKSLRDLGIGFMRGFA
jgi:hypothetical protein